MSFSNSTKRKQKKKRSTEKKKKNINRKKKRAHFFSSPRASCFKSWCLFSPFRILRFSTARTGKRKRQAKLLFAVLFFFFLLARMRRKHDLLLRSSDEKKKKSLPTWRYSEKGLNVLDLFPAQGKKGFCQKLAERGPVFQQHNSQIVNSTTFSPRQRHSKQKKDGQVRDASSS